MQYHHEKTMLQADASDLDILQWESLCDEVRMLRIRGDYLNAIEREKQAASILTGMFLMADGDIARRLFRSEQICTWIEATIKHWRNDDHFDDAQTTKLFDIWQQLEPASERLCMQRMNALLDLGDTDAAMRVYHAWVQRNL